MRKRKLGLTGIEVSEIGFGAWAIGGTGKLGELVTGWGKTDDEKSISALETAYDCGINFYDTADVYGMGHSENLIGKVFKGKRDKVVIATKGGNRDVNGKWVKDFSASYITSALEHSLRRLSTDYIDVYFLHTPRGNDQFKECIETFSLLEKMRLQGKILSYGISVADENQGIEMIHHGKGQVIQVVHNILTPGPESNLFPLAKEHNVGIVTRVPLASGFLTGKFTRDTHFSEDDNRHFSYPPDKIAETVNRVELLRFLQNPGRTLAQASLQYILSMDAVSSVIPGAKNPEQVLENAQASELGSLTDEELERIRTEVR